MATVLLIDDDSSRSGALIESIRHQHYDCHTTPPSADAVDLARELKPDLIVVGLCEEPGVTAALCEQLQTTALADCVPIMIAGDASLNERALECVARGASDWLSLPLTESLIEARIRTFVTMKRHQELIRVQDRVLAEKSEDLDSTRISLHDSAKMLKEARATERFLATHDHVTGLPNRQLFDEFVQRSIDFAKRHDQHLAVLSLNLDRFTRVNDNLSHSVGDRLLKSVAGRVKDCLRSSEMIARPGGDELTAVLLNLRSPGDAEAVAEKVLRRVAEPHAVGGREVRLTSSIGIALFPQDGGDREELLRAANLAMRSVKEEGGNSHAFFSPEMTAGQVAHPDLEQDILTAVEREEFVLHYQPQVDARKGTLVGAEVLVRWQHPERGLIPPSEFIPLAEESGCIHELGAWVLEKACIQKRRWEDLDFPSFPISVNVSLRQLKSKSFAELVVQVLDETGLDPTHLDLEVTENMIMDDVEVACETLTILSDIGIRVSIDDFGTGYSSLSVLGKFPAHTLKIDRAFVMDITTNPVQAAITRTVIAVASELGLEVIAEGVETEEQMEFLADLGCILMQGYLFGRPLDLQGFEEQWRDGESEFRLKER